MTESISSEPAAATRLPLRTWLGEGLRASIFLPARVATALPTPLQLAAVVALVALLEIGLGRLEIPGPASFDLRGWLAPWWSTAAILFLAWWALPAAGSQRSPGLAAWFLLWTAGLLPATLVSLALGIVQGQDAAPDWLGQAWAAWGLSLGLWAWTIAVSLRLGRQFGAPWPRLVWLGLGLVAVYAVMVWQFPDRPWQADTSGEPDPPRLELSQEAFEAQQALWSKSVAELAPERPGVAEVYGLVFAPYAREDVFLRESSMVARLLAERFDAQGRVLHLVNHVDTVQTHPWATPLNLERAIEALAGRMDRDNDVLVVYLTSHGASDYQLAAAHWPLEVGTVSPGELRQALDKAGIRNRVIAISACYSGGWVGPLSGDSTLLMTAADATHTSYGCGRLSELTFFGRAVFDEQLRKTHSFEQAFAAAVPLIRQREIDAGKDDGFSNPQISVGEKIRPVLQALQQRLDSR